MDLEANQPVADEDLIARTQRRQNLRMRKSDALAIAVHIVDSKADNRIAF